MDGPRDRLADCTHMVESVGKKLHQARLQRGLTIDEAAHATKLRPDKIAALESDDYTRFANNIYAKGFLQIYGRFLKVDVEDFARTLDNANPISISDYQYLSNAPAAKTEAVAVRREERRPPSVAPLLAFIVMVGVGFTIWWAVKMNDRVKRDSRARSDSAHETTATPVPNPDAAFINEPPVATRPAATPPAAGPTPGGVPRVTQTAPGPATPAPSNVATPRAATPGAVATTNSRPATPVPVIGAGPRPATPAPLAVPRATTPAPLATVNSRSATPAPAPGATPAAKSAEQDFVKPSPVATDDNSTRPAGVNEVLIATVKTTWVTIRRDDPKAPPIFEDNVYPNTKPLKLKGARFYIEARDPSAVQITKNGLPYAYQPNGSPVQ